MKNFIKPTLIILGMLLVTIIAGAVIALMVSSQFSERRVSMTILEITGVSAVVTSSSDGSKHRVDMDLYFELGDELLPSVSAKETKKQLQQMISTLDYDQLVSGDSVEYVSEYLASQISEDIDHREVGNVYVTNIVTGGISFYTAGGEVEEAVPEKTFDVRTMQRFNGLFGTD